MRSRARGPSQAHETDERARRVTDEGASGGCGWMEGWGVGSGHDDDSSVWVGGSLALRGRRRKSVVE